ncbi:MAG: hypothetical protein Q9191_003613, partial [Dirinaria sp. TL-2023a]
MSQNDIVREPNEESQQPSISPSPESSETQTGHASPVPESTFNIHSKVSGTIEGHNTNEKSAGDAEKTAETNQTRGSSENAHTPKPMPEDDTLGSSKDPLEEYSWAELEERFAARMEECGLKEVEIWKEFQEWLEVFKAWTSVTSVHEEERASKR